LKSLPGDCGSIDEWFCLQDISAGRCQQNSDPANARQMTQSQAQAFKMCGFNSMEGFELAEHLECDVRPQHLQLLFQ
jgi:hypothetical protein